MYAAIRWMSASAAGITFLARTLPAAASHHRGHPFARFGFRKPFAALGLSEAFQCPGVAISLLAQMILDQRGKLVRQEIELLVRQLPGRIDGAGEFGAHAGNVADPGRWAISVKVTSPPASRSRAAAQPLRPCLGGTIDPMPAPVYQARVARVFGGDRMTGFSRQFLDHAAAICGMIDAEQIDRVATGLAAVRDAGGRLFVLGVGGGAGNAGHAVNDLRKLCDVEAYAPTDNVAESFQAVVWHCLVSHPALKKNPTKW